MASWAQRLVGVFVEKVEDEELPETLTPAAPARPSTRPQPSRVQHSARAQAPAAPQVQESEAEIPAAIKQVIDAQFQDAASPARRSRKRST